MGENKIIAKNIENHWFYWHFCRLRPLSFTESGINTADTCCRLLNDFMSGEFIDHSGKFAILTNLMSVDSGVKRFFEILKRHYDEDTCQKWENDYKYMKGYQPKRCSAEFCPYYSVCYNKGTMLDTIAADRKIYRDKKWYATVDEASECLRQNLNEAFLSQGNGIHLIKAQTALGKTEAYINLVMKYPDCKFIIAVPTNKLKMDVLSRLSFEMAEKEIFVTPSVDDDTALIPPEIKVQVASSHQIGLHNKTKTMVLEYLESVSGEKKAVIEICTKIVEGVKAIENERVIITTHAYLLQMPEDFLRNYTIIIDEDILYLQMLSNSNKVSFDLVKTLAEKNIPGYTEIAQRILETQEKEYMKVYPDPFAVSLSEKQIEEYGLWGDDEDNVNDLVFAGAFMKENGIVHYFCPQKLKPMKYIILSATLNCHLYELYFGNSMDIVEYPQVDGAYRGKLIQYTYHSLGRRDLEQKKEVFELVRKLSGNEYLPIITFKKFEKMAGDRANGMHFGNAIGIDKLKNCDIGVIGTPYKLDMAYKLVACYLGADVNSRADANPRPRRVEYNGNSFRVTTYDDVLLREIQLHSLESELEQAIGRARLLRSDCTVYLFSCFPCEQAELRTGDYLQSNAAAPDF